MKKIIKRLSRIKFNRYVVLLTILSVAFLAGIMRYAWRSYAYPVWDEQHYMYMAAGFYRLFQHISFSTPYDMLQLVPFRQPGYPLFMMPLLTIFGLSNSYFWGIVTNGIFYVTTIFGIYFLTKIYLSRLASFLASFIFMFYGWPLLHVHLTYSETATSALCLLSILFLIKSNLFQNRKYSILFGLFLGLGLLTRWTTVVYVFGPLVYVLYQIVKKNFFKEREILINFALSIFLTIILSVYPYYTNYYWVMQYFYGTRTGGPMWQMVAEQERNPLSLYSLTFYLTTFEQLGIFYFILIVAGFILALRKKSKLRPILLAVVVTYMFFSYALLKTDRHIIPIFPYLAILSASVFDHIKNNKYKTGLIFIVIILSIGTYLGSFWGKGPMKQSLYSFPLQLPFGVSTRIYLTSVSRPPYIYKISGREIVDFIAKDSKDSGIKDPQVLALFYYRPLDEPLMTYNLYSQEKPLAINNFLGTVLTDPEIGSEYLINSMVKSSDYLIVKTGKRTDEFFSKPNYETLEAFITLFDSNYYISKYYEEKTKIWIYQDSSTVTIYKKKEQISDADLMKMRLRFIEILKEKRAKL